MANNSQVVITTQQVGDQFVHAGHTYVLAPLATTQTSAQSWAQDQGGQLVSLQSAEENAWVFNTFAANNRNLWLGLTDSATEGTWQWADGTAAPLQLWNANEPNNYPHTPQIGEDYALMLSSTFGANGAWADVPNINPGDFGLWVHGLAELDTTAIAPGAGAALAGSPRVGQILWATSRLDDTDGTPAADAIGWQWLANDVAISDATGRAYTVVATDLGKTISVTTTYLNGAGQTQTAVSTSTGAVMDNQLPAGSVTLSGLVAEGETLAATHDLTDGDGLSSSVTYQWYANGVPIERATSGTLLLTSAQVGQAITAQARYTDGNGYVEQVMSGATAPVANTNDPGFGQVVISGQPLSVGYEYQGHRYQLVNTPQTHDEAQALASALGGHLLTINDLNENEWIYGQFSGDAHHLWLGISDAAKEGTWLWGDGGAPGFALPWMAGEPNNGAGAATEAYAILHAGASGRWADVPNAIPGVAMYTVIEWDNNTSTAVTGEALTHPPLQGQVLSASTLLNDLDGLNSLGYSGLAVQWFANGKAIAGATAFQYAPQQADVGKALHVTVTYTDAAGFANTLSSTPSQAVLNVNDAPVGAVVITGNLMQGQTVTATPLLSDLDGLPPDGLASAQYQWLADGAYIPNATGATHTLTSFSVGTHLSVQVSYTDAQGTMETVEGNTQGWVASASETNRAPSFVNGDGAVSAHFGSITESAHGLVVDSSGRILVISGDQELGAVRFLANGQLDTSYGIAGKAFVAGGQAMAGALDAQGRLLVGGTEYTGGTTGWDLRIARFNADGSLDTYFGNQGTVQTAGLGDNTIHTLISQPDGKILAIGQANTTAREVYLVRYEGNGVLDTSFGSGGLLSLKPDGREAVALNGAVAADGSIFLTGAIASATDPNSTDQMVLKLTASGAVDTSFGTAGVVALRPPGTAGQTWANPIIIQSNGQLLVAGTGVHEYWPGPQLARLNADGSLDTSYGQSGFSATLGFTGHPTGMVMDSDFQVFVSTQGYQLSPARIVKFTDAGELDSAFGNQGVVTPAASSLWGAALASDGGLLVSGTFSNAGLLGNDVGVMKFAFNGSPDTTFGGGVSTLADTETNYLEDGPAVVLDGNVQLIDPELSVMNAGLGNYSGAQLTLQRATGASAHDQFGVLADRGIGALTEGQALKIDGVAMGMVTINSLGVLQIDWTATVVTQAQLDRLMRAITYQNTSDTPDTRPQIAWLFNDGNTGSQGLGGQQTVVGYTQLNITPSNDPPQVFAPTTLAFAEDTAGSLSGISFTDPDHTSPTDVFLLRLIVSDGWLMPNAPAAAALGLTIETYHTNDIGLRGTRTDILSYLDQGWVQFQPAPNATQDVALSIDVLDAAGDWGGYRGQHKVVTLTVTGVADHPDNVAGGSVDFYETPFNSIYDGVWIDLSLILQDDDPGLVQGARVSISNGLSTGDVLAFADAGSITGQYNADTGVLTLSGSASYADYQAALRGVRFGSHSDTPDATHTTRTISWEITDSQGITAPAVNSTINVKAINDAPGFVYQAIVLTEDAASPLNTLVIGDPDAGIGAVTVSLSQQATTQGLFTSTGLATQLGVAVTGEGEPGMTLTGPVVNINTLLASGGVIYTPTADFAGTVWLGIEVSDGGYSGIDGVKSSGQAYYEHVMVPLPDAPLVTAASTLEDTQTTHGLVITPNPVDGLSITHFRIDHITGGTLYLADGTTPVLDGDVIGVQHGLAGLRFLPSPNSSGSGSFDIQSATGILPSQTGTEVTTATITVNAANDAPTGNVFVTTLPNQPLQQGSTLMASHTLVDPDGIPTSGADALTYQWQLSSDQGNNWLDLAGATSTTLLLGQNEVGQLVRVTAHYHDLGGMAETVASAATSVVNNVNDPVTGTITILGETTQGQVLTASHTLSDMDGLGAISYQWLANGVPIADAITPNYVLTQAEVGKTISVKASYTDQLGAGEMASSLTTAVVANVNDAPTGTVSITGTAAQGATLTASHALVDADGLGTIGYQWLAGGLAIGGASAGSYTLTQAEVGKAISVVARYTDLLGTAEQMDSTPTVPVIPVGNQPPITQPATRVSVYENSLVVGTFATTDIDDTALSYSLSGLLSDRFAIDTQTGELQFVQAPNFETDPTDYHLSVRATDAAGLFSEQTVVVTVLNANDTPQGRPSVQGLATQGQVLTLDATPVLDEDGITVLDQQWKANGFDIVGATGSTLTLGNGQVGKLVSVTVRYTDGLNNIHTLHSDSTAPVTARPVSAITGGSNNDHLVGSDAIDQLDGQAGNDTLLGRGGNDTLLGGSGDDTLAGGAGDDHMDGGAGTDTADYSAWTEAVNLDLQRGLSVSAADTDLLLNIEDVIGTDFGDRVSGSNSANRLVGNAGDDWLRGEAGNDTLAGGAGNDLLAGGAGADTFQIAALGGQDRVLDFSRADGDTIAILNDLNGTGIASATDLLSRISASGNDSVVDLGNGHTLTVVGIGAATWLVTDFQVV